MFETELRRKVAWLIFVRVVISTILLGSATVAQITAPGSFAVDPFFFLIGLTFALTISYALTLRLVDRHRWLVDVQLAADALIVSAFISFTGGITSFSPRSTFCRSSPAAPFSSAAAACSSPC